MSPRLRRWLIGASYPLVYVVAALLFVLFTFPFERLKERVETEFAARQGPEGYRLKIGELDLYWLSGLEARDVRLFAAPKKEAAPAEPSPTPAPSGSAAAKPSRAAPMVALDHLWVSYAPLTSLVSGTTVYFGATIGDGSLSGYVVDTAKDRKVHVELKDVDVSRLPLLPELVGLPMKGTASAKLDLTAPGKRLNKADGQLELTVAGFTIGDGRATIKGIKVPPIRAGELRLSAEAKAGKLTINELSTKGKDLELASEGSLRMREPFGQSFADLTLRFRFSEAYKNQSDLTKGMFEAMSFMPETRRALGPDGFYGWRLLGMLAKPSFTPNGSAAAPRRPPTAPPTAAP